MQPLHLKLTLAFAAISAIAFVAHWGWRRSHSAIDADLLQRHTSFQSMHTRASEVQLVAVSPDPRALTDVIRQSLQLNGSLDQIPTDITSSLASTFAKTLSLRYAHPPADYVQWMLTSGERIWQKEEVAKFGWDLDATAKHYLGNTATSFDGAQTQLPQIMAESDRRNSGSSRIVRISLHADHWEAAVKRVTPEDPNWPDIPGKIGKAVANGATIASVKTWWAVDSQFKHAFNKHGSTYAAFIAGVVECADGKRRSVYWAFVYDVERAVWTCSNIAVVLDPNAKENAVRFEL